MPNVGRLTPIVVGIQHTREKYHKAVGLFSLIVKAF